MTKLKEVFSIIKDWRLEHSDYFVKGFCGLVKDSIKEFVIDDSKTVLMFLDIFKNADNLIFRYLSSNNDNSIIYISFGVDADNIVYEIEFSTIDETIRLKIFDNNYCLLDDFRIFCKRIDFDTLFLLDEKNTSEPEQPVEDAEEQENPEQTEEDAEEQDNPEQTEEDAEEQENPEQTPAEDAEELEDNQAYELTPLERILFEEHQKCLSSSISYLNMAHEAESEDEHDMYLSDASSATLIFEYISNIINQACLAGKYSAWLQERKKQEVVGVSK